MPAPYLQTYFSPSSTVVNFATRSVPTDFRIVMMATAMPAAIRPYSIAVTPDSLDTKRERKFIIVSTCKIHPDKFSDAQRRILEPHSALSRNHAIQAAPDFHCSAAET